jgi:hypothetical protein
VNGASQIQISRRRHALLGMGATTALVADVTGWFV